MMGHGDTMGHGGMMGGWGMRGPMRGFADEDWVLRRVDGRLAFLKAELKITEAQTPAWDGVAATVKNTVETHNAMMRSMMADRMSGEFFKKPLPGILPTMLPRLALEESLSYRISWQEMQLGELISSINLAPGEERQVTMTRAFERETTVSRSTTSVFDISQTDSTDLATEMENQSRQESQQSQNLDELPLAGFAQTGFQ